MNIQSGVFSLVVTVILYSIVMVLTAQVGLFVQVVITSFFAPAFISAFLEVLGLVRNNKAIA